MIKILKINSEKIADFAEAIRNYGPLELAIHDKKLSYLFLNHDAYRINVIRSDGVDHTVKIAGEIFKLKTPQLFSILIKVYNMKFVSYFGKSEDDQYRGDIYDYVYDALSYDDKGKWTVLVHKDTFDLLERLFPNRSREMIKSHILQKIDLYISKRTEREVEELKGMVYWNLYKVMNTRKDLGINFTINSKEFSALSKLFIIDFMYETLMNKESLLDSNILYSSSAINERMEQVILLLDSIGKFALNFSKFNSVLTTMSLCLPRFGLPTYLANNLLEEKYLKNNVSNNIGFNYVDAIWEKRYEVINKIKEFISFHDGAAAYPFGENFINGQGVGNVMTAYQQGCPEPAMEFEPGQVDLRRDEYNNPTFVGVNVDYNNMYIILFRDLMLAFTGIKERWNTAKNANAEDMNKDLILKDLKDLYNRVLDARYRLRGGNSDTVDLDSLEDQIFTLTTEIQNYQTTEAVAEALGIGEEMKIPGFITDFINNRKEIKEKKKEEAKERKKAIRQEKLEEKQFRKDAARKKLHAKIDRAKKNFMIDLFRVLDSIPSMGILPGTADLASKIESKMFARDQKKKDREREKAEWKEQLGHKNNYDTKHEYKSARKAYLKPKRERIGGRESFYGYLSLKGYTTDELFRYDTVTGFSEGIKEFVGDKIKIFVLNGVLKRISNEKHTFSPGEKKKIKEKIEKIYNSTKNKEVKKLSSKIIKLVSGEKNNSGLSNNTIGLKESFGLMNEAHKRNYVLNVIGNIDNILNKVNPNIRENVILNLGESFDGYLSKKQKDILKGKLDDIKKQH